MHVEEISKAYDCFAEFGSEVKGCEGDVLRAASRAIAMADGSR